MRHASSGLAEIRRELGSIPDPKQNKSTRRRGKAGQRAVPPLEQSLKLVPSHETAPQFEKRASHVSDHMMQKPVPLDGQRQPVPRTLQLTTEDMAHRALPFPSFCSETGKIVCALEQLRGPHHDADIDGIRVMKMFARKMRWNHRSAIDLVSIYL